MVQENKISVGHSYYKIEIQNDNIVVMEIVIDGMHTQIVADRIGTKHMLYYYDYTVYDMETKEVIHEVKNARPSMFKNLIFANLQRAFKHAIDAITEKKKVLEDKVEQVNVLIEQAKRKQVSITEKNRKRR